MKHETRFTAMPVAGILLAFGIVMPSVAAAGGHADQHADQHRSDQHMELTPGQIAQLRSRISALQGVPDAMIQAGMRHMHDEWEVLSEPDVRGDVGILALGHGFGADGDAQFKEAFAGFARRYPTAVALGMAMMDSNHIREAVAALEAAGATTIVALPVQIGQNTSLIRQWDYIFGRRERGAYLDTARVTPSACLAISPALGTDPVVADIVSDALRPASRDPARETVVLIGHGPEEADDNDRELAALAGHAARIRYATGIADVRRATLQDDAPADVRAANVAGIRQMVSSAVDDGRRVLVLPVVITGGGYVTAKIRRDLEGLDYELIDAGIVQSPRITRWIASRMAMAESCE